MLLRIRPATLTLFVILSTMVSKPSQADVVIEIAESGGDVTASLSGELNLDATLGFSGTFGAPVFWPANGYISVGSIGTGTADGYSINTTAPNYGPGTFGTWDSSTGDFFGFRLFEQPFLYVPQGYVSGTALAGSSTEIGTDLATLGFTPGIYTSTITGAGGVTDNITVRIAAIPEPSSVLVLSLAVSLGMLRRRRTT